MSEQQYYKRDKQCLDSGLLMRLRDGELNHEEEADARAHLATCAHCVAEEQDMQSVSGEVYSLLSSLQPTNTIPDASKALASLQTKLRSENNLTLLSKVPLRMEPLPKVSKRQSVRVRWIGIAAAVLIALLLLPNAGALANQVLSLFRVQQFEPVNLDATQVQKDFTNSLAQFGNLKIEMRQEAAPFQQISQEEVEKQTHFHVRLPSHLPAGVPTTPEIQFFAGMQGTFTFDQQKVRQYIQQIGDGNVAIPAQLDHATYTVTMQTGAIARYMQPCKEEKSAEQCVTDQRVVIAEIPSPTVQETTRGSLATLRNFILSLPHIPTNTRILWQNLDLNRGIVPLPIQTGVTGEAVTVHGHPGVLLASGAIHYGGVIWQEQGIIYGLVVNTSDKAEIFAVVNSLK